MWLKSHLGRCQESPVNVPTEIVSCICIGILDKHLCDAEDDVLIMFLEVQVDQEFRELKPNTWIW